MTIPREDLIVSDGFGQGMRASLARSNHASMKGMEMTKLVDAIVAAMGSEEFRFKALGEPQTLKVADLPDVGLMTLLRVWCRALGAGSDQFHRVRPEEGDG